MIKRILLATDFSEGAAHAVPYAADLSRRYEAKLYIIHVIHDIVRASGWYVPLVDIDELAAQLYKDMEAKAWKELEKICEKLAGCKDIEYRLLKGVPYEEILKFAKDNDIDLIIMGTHSRVGTGRVVLGSTAEKVVRNSHCPVLVVGPRV